VLGPILARLTRYASQPSVEPVAPPAPAEPLKPGTHRAWNSVREMAEQATLSDLTVAMAVFMSV
jgi:hypothetical protein